jgi:hypothetical protein
VAPNVRGMLAPVLLLVAALSVPATPVPDTAAIVPRRQVLDLIVDPARDRWSAGLRGWLTVRRPMRRFVLRFTGPVVSRVEMNQLAGAVPLNFGTPHGDSLLVETDRPLVQGPAGLNVGFVGTFADSGHGFVRLGPGRVRLALGAGVALPAWPGGTPATPWRLDVHVPAGCVVRANLRRTEISRQGAWRTWSFASSRPLPADSLRLEVVRPAR